VFAVAGEPQSRRDHQLGRAAGARPFHRAADDVETGAKIGAVDAITFETVAFGAVDQIRAGEFAVVRRGIGVMVIRGHDHERDLLDRGDIHAFVGGAGLHSAFPDGGETDKILFAFCSFRH
jgi:hypothetical protein